jgi:two-component system, chemotaxis family, chemotaxis protein CheY
MAKAGKHTVLVADDDAILKMMLKSILESSGEYQVVAQAVNGEEAVARYAQMKPHLVLLDINMPKMDGLQALEEIRKINPAAKVMMVSGDSTIDKVKEAIQKGASGFVVKPLTASGVLKKIQACLNAREKK